MKTKLLSLLLTLAVFKSAHAADYVKVSQMPEATTVSGTALSMVAVSSGTTYVSKKIAIGNLSLSLDALDHVFSGDVTLPPTFTVGAADFTLTGSNALTATITGTSGATLQLGSGTNQFPAATLTGSTAIGGTTTITGSIALGGTITNAAKTTNTGTSNFTGAVDFTGATVSNFPINNALTAVSPLYLTSGSIGINLGAGLSLSGTNLVNAGVLSVNGATGALTGYLTSGSIGVSVQAYNVSTTLLGNATTGSGSIVLATSPSLITPTLGVASATSLAITGTGGAGFASFVPQATAPGTPGSGFSLYARSTGGLAWKGSNGFERALDGGALTASRIYNLPDASGTFALTSIYSGTGGANMVPQFDSNGNLVTGYYSNVGVGLGTGAGNVLIPDRQMVRWMSTEDPTVTTAYIWYWETHDNDNPSGEMAIVSRNSIAILGNNRLQFGSTASARDGFYLEMYASASSSFDALRPSRAILMDASTWTSGTSVAKAISMQNVPLDASGTNYVLQFKREAVVALGNTSGTSGNVAGIPLAELSSTGMWTAGTEPPFQTLAASGTTFTLPLDNHLTRQPSQLTLTANSVLVLSGTLANGMHGDILIMQDSAGSHTLTLPTNFAPFGSMTLSTTPGAGDWLHWDYNGQYAYAWLTGTNATLPTDPDAAVFFTATGLSGTSANGIAINNYILQLKANSLWRTSGSSGLVAFYPFVGSGSSACAVNLTGTDHKLVFHGTLTYDGNGVTGDGSTGWASNDIKPSALAGAPNTLMFYVYNRTPTLAANNFFFSADVSNYCALLVGTSTAIKIQGLNTTTNSGPSVTSGTNMSGHIAAMALSGTNENLYFNSSMSTSGYVAVSNTNTVCIWVDNGGTGTKTAANFGCAAIATFNTDAQYQTFKTLTDNLMTALGRH